jgi:hypothetical protein
MVTTAVKFWSSIASTAALLLCAAAAAPAKAQTPCPSSKLIAEIVNSVPPEYTCDLGNITYEFNQTLNNFYFMSTDATIVFSDTPTFQKISFQLLKNNSILSFYFRVTSPYEAILQIDQEASLNSSPPLYPPFGLTAVTTSVDPLPSNPSTIPFDIEAIYDPDTSVLPQPPIINALTYTIYKTPAPLPLAGTGFVFALTRKLRKRIRQMP